MGMVMSKVCDSLGCKKGTMILSKTLLASILVLASALIIFLIIKNIICKTGAGPGGVC